MDAVDCGDPVEQADLFRALHQIAVALAGVLDARTLASLVAERARQLVQADAVGLFEWNAAAGVLEPLYTVDAPSEHAIRPGEGAVGQAFEQGRPIVVDDYATHPTALPWAVERGTRTAAAVPLVVDDRRVGVLAVRNHRACAMSRAHIEILVLLAAFVAPALEATRLYAECDRQRRHASEQSERLAAILEQLPSAVFVLAERGQIVISNQAARSLAPELPDPLRSLATLVERVLLGQTIEATEVAVRNPEHDAERRLHVTGAPLHDQGGQFSGAVLVATDVTHERTLARDLAATALEHARLLGQLADRKARLERLAREAADPAPEPLTRRELVTLQLIARGQTNREIGEALHLSPGTIRNRVGRLLEKLGAADRTQAAVIAVTRGLLLDVDSDP